MTWTFLVPGPQISGPARTQIQKTHTVGGVGETRKITVQFHYRLPKKHEVVVEALRCVHVQHSSRCTWLLRVTCLHIYSMHAHFPLPAHYRYWKENIIPRACNTSAPLKNGFLSFSVCNSHSASRKCEQIGKRFKRTRSPLIKWERH